MSTTGDLRVDVVTIFADYLAPLRQSLVGRAVERGQIDLRLHDLRRWTDDVHRSVDDTPYGGGPGMVMSPEPWGRALDEIAPPGGSNGDTAGTVSTAATPTLIVPTPTGVPFTQSAALELSRAGWLIFACGRYEGIDARVAEHAATRMPVRELSLGDYVLAGGEVAVLVIVEAVARLLPGVLGNAESAADDSFGEDGLLEAPAYTKPPVWRGLAVPDVLRSGHHAEIDRWRRERAAELTKRRRPDLLPPAGP